MTVELIFVGTELLLGDILNTNAQYISQKLADVGASVLFQTVVGDNEFRLTECLELALSRADMVITTGGLGPTADDITKEVCAAVCKKELVCDDESLQRMLAYFATKGIEPAKSNEKQAYMPENSYIVRNTNGTAPGCVMKSTEGKPVAVLPGPPREMKPMLDDVIEHFIAPKTGVTIKSHSIRTFGIGESTMAETVADLLDGSNPTVAPYAKSGEALLRVTAMGKSDEDCEKIMAPVIAEIERRLGSYIYGIDVSGIDEATVRFLKEHNISLATAESCTGGLIAKRITDVSGASRIFGCGIVSYSNEVKQNVLGVKADDIKKYGPVSETVAKQMADGVRRISGAEIGISVTGIAGPESDETGKEVGLIYVGVSSRLGTRTVEIKTGHKGTDCRDYNRIVASSVALNEARKECKALTKNT